MSFRGMDMLIFALIMPLVVLVILGLVFGQKPAFEGAPYTFALLRKAFQIEVMQAALWDFRS